jgi:surfactin synthase thioesterase subunit
MWKLGQEHPYVLIGYSFGGIILKQLVLEVLQRYYKDVIWSRAFVENMLGVVFYAVPHAGSQLRKFMKQSDRILHTNVQAYIGVETKLFEQKMAELSDDFESVLKTSPTAHVLTFAESKPSKNMVSIPIYVITFAKKCRTLHGMVAISPFMLNLYLWIYVLMKLTFEIDFKVNK